MASILDIKSRYQTLPQGNKKQGDPMKTQITLLSAIFFMFLGCSAFAQSQAFLSSLDRSKLANAYSLKSVDEPSYFQTTDTSMATEDESGWMVNFTPYLWMAGMSGDATLRGIEVVDIDISFSDILDDLDFGFAGHMEATKNKFTMFFDINYINISEKPQTIVVRVKNTVGELGATYHLGLFEILGGVRIIKWKLELTPSQIPTTFERSKTFVDPIIGARIKGPVSRIITLGARGDIGGFGVGSDFSWNIILDADIRIARWGALYGGYRWWQDDYGENDNKDFQLDLLTSGPILGFTFYF
jgi:hypothetical protein